MLSGSANSRTSVLFSLKSVIFLSRLDGNVPTDVTEGRSSLLHTVERVEARMDERTEQDRHASWVCHPGHFHANLRQMQFDKPAGRKKKQLIRIESFGLQAGSLIWEITIGIYLSDTCWYLSSLVASPQLTVVNTIMLFEWVKGCNMWLIMNS